jgi:hypothetical protein
MSELLKKLATQFGYEGREDRLAAELRAIVKDAPAMPAEDFPKTPKEALVSMPPAVEEAKPVVINVFDPTGTAFPGIKPTKPKK